MIDLSKDTTACFIERGEKINPSARLFIGKWLKWTSNTIEQDRLSYAQYIRTEILSALEKEEEVWSAVRDSDHIWCQSYLDGESGALFLKMLRRAKESGMRNKVFFDVAMRSDTMRDMAMYRSEIEELVADLETNYGNEFLFFHEIVRMMK
jgi:hypothetical protein